MSNDTTFSFHTEMTMVTVRKLIGWILRTFKTRNVNLHADTTETSGNTYTGKPCR